MAATGLDEAKVRDSVARIVEDVTVLVDPQKAAFYGQRVRGFFTKTAPPAGEVTGSEPGGNGTGGSTDAGQPPPA